MVLIEREKIEQAREMAKDLFEMTNKELAVIINNESPITNPVNNKNRFNVILGILSDEFGDDIVNHNIINVKDLNFNR